MNANRKSNLMIALYLGLVFVAGLAVGVFGQRLYASKSVEAVSRPSTPDQWRAKYMADMQTRLQLSTEQVTQLGTILDQTRQQYRELRERQRPEMKRVQDEQVSKINAILNDTQRVEYARFREEKDRARAKSKRD